MVERMRDDLRKAAAIDAVADLIDIESLESCLADWPAGAPVDHDEILPRQARLISALTAFRFIRMATGSNAP